MNRLEEIKERFDCRLLDEDEITYILQRIEHYKTALKKIEVSETHLQAKFFAMEALKD